ALAPVAPPLRVLAEGRGRHPVPPVAGPGIRPAGQNAESEGVAEPGRKNFRLRPVLRDLEQAPAGRRVVVAGLEEVEVALRVGFETRVEGVFSAAGVPVVVEALVEIGLAVVVVVI